MSMLVLDGSRGEGGGQILRTALALSTLTGKPFRIQAIRAKRKKPGLLRQHLTCVNAAAAICGAEVRDAELGSQQLTFVPGKLRHGDYSFAIGTAGSTTLVLQTLFFGLLNAEGASSVVIEGGTHNPLAPPFDFLEHAFIPLMARMGAQANVELVRPGFHPAGGGSIRARFQGKAAWLPLDLTRPHHVSSIRAVATVSSLSREIAARELAVIADGLSLTPEALSIAQLKGGGPGNIVSVFVENDLCTEVFTAVGERGVSAEDVAKQVVTEVKEYLAAEVPVGRYLADQLLMPMALAGGGAFRTLSLSEHAVTQIATLKHFLELGVSVREQGPATTVEVVVP